MTLERRRRDGVMRAKCTESTMIENRGEHNHHTLFNSSLYRSFKILSDVTNMQQAMDGVLI